MKKILEMFGYVLVKEEEIKEYDLTMYKLENEYKFTPSVKCFIECKRRLIDKSSPTKDFVLRMDVDTYAQLHTDPEIKSHIGYGPHNGYQLLTYKELFDEYYTHEIPENPRRYVDGVEVIVDRRVVGWLMEIKK